MTLKALILLPLTFVATAAFAQPVYVERLERRPAYVEQRSPGPYARYAPAMCQRWCPEDPSPCDPTYFKIADGRCRGVTLPQR